MAWIRVGLIALKITLQVKVEHVKQVNISNDPEVAVWSLYVESCPKLYQGISNFICTSKLLLSIKEVVLERSVR